MRALQALVIFMGVLLVAGIGILVVTLAHRLEGRVVAAPSATPGHAVIPVPAGARIEEMVAAGDRVVLRVLLPSGQTQLLVVDPARGRLIETVALQAATP